jgi:sugar O-acyltransferase (sialic acid O-acetyltransferase NeuD family)
MKLFIYCAGGFGLEIIDLARRINRISNTWDQIGFIDDIRKENEYYGVSLYSFDEVLSKFDGSTFEVVVANGEPFIRRDLFNKLITNQIQLATLIDETAIVSETAKIGKGVIIPAKCFVSSCAIIEDNVTMNIDSLVGHEAIVSKNCVISPSANIAGKCFIGENTYVGMGAQIKQGTKIGAGAIIGMGSIVYNDISDNVVALGNPARPMKKNTSERVFS